MKRFLLSFSLSIVSLLGLAACRGQATPTPAALATNTPQPPPPTLAPTDPPTAAPTHTPAPPTETPTLTPEPTATTAATVTPDPEQGVGDVVFEDRFDGTSGWGWTFSGDGVSFGAVDGQLRATMTRTDIGWGISLGPDGLRTANHQIKVTSLPQTCANGDEYGVFFRGALSDEGKFDGYVFKLNCSGQARVELLRASEPSVLVNWSAASAIASGPAQNALTIWMAGSEFRFYVNGEYWTTLTETTFAEGDFGFYLWNRAGGELHVRFDDLGVRAVSLP